MIIQTNMLAMYGARNLGLVGNAKAKSQEKLSSGYRINRSADDAAGLAISEKMRRKIRCLNQGAENMQDGISLVQVADGALNETQEMLQRLNELVIHAANETNSAEERSAINQEINQLKAEIDRVADTTNFNEAVFPLKAGNSSNVVYDTVKVQIPFSSISFPDFTSSDVGFDKMPFGQNTPLDTLSLFVQVEGTGTDADGQFYSLLYTGSSGTKTPSDVINGNTAKTSYPTVLYSYMTGGGNTVSKSIPFSQITQKVGDPVLDSANGKWERTFAYTDEDDPSVSFWIRQTVTMDQGNKEYRIDTELIDTGDTPLKQSMIVMNLDTSYKGGTAGDHNEGYYLNETGPQVGGQSLYTPPITSTSTSVVKALGSEGSGIWQTYDKVGVHAIDTDGALPSHFIIGGKDKDETDDWMPFAIDVRINPTQSLVGATTSTVNMGVTSLSASGMPTDLSIKDYAFDADESGILVNGTHYNYADIKTEGGASLNDASISGGTYFLTHNGVTFQLNVATGSDKSEIAQSVRTAHVNIEGAYDHSHDITSHFDAQLKADTAEELNQFRQTHPELIIHADADRIWLDNLNYVSSWDIDAIVEELNTGTNNQGRGHRAYSTFEYGDEWSAITSKVDFLINEAGGGLVIMKENTEDVTREELIAAVDGAKISLGELTYSNTYLGNEWVFDFTNTIHYEDKSEGTVTVTQPTPVQKTIQTGGTLETDPTNGNFLVLGQYHDNKISFINNYQGSGTGSDLYGIDHSFSYGTIGKKNSISIGIIDTTSMVTSGGQPVQYAETEIKVPRIVDEEGKKKVSIKNSDEEDWTDIYLVDATCKGIGIENVGSLTAQEASDSIEFIKHGIEKVNRYRSYFGAVQNRIEHSYAVNQNTSENTSAAESRIRDTDMAKEMAKYAQQNILEQAGASMLAQANQSGNGVLKLLQ